MSKNPPVLLSWIHKRMERNKNLIIMINGETGSGKSYAGLRLAYEVSEMFNTPFSIKGNLGFTFPNLIKKMQLPGNDVPNVCFVMEEVGSTGSGGSSREWQSKANNFFSSFLQTSRSRNQILIMSTPSFANLEKGARSLVHVQMESLGINYQAKVSCFKPYILQVNRTSGKTYFKYLRYSYEGTRYALKKQLFKLPPNDLIIPYEVEKRKFQAELDKKIMQSEDIPKTDKRASKLNMEALTILLQKGLKQTEIAEVMGISDRTIRKYKNSLLNGTKIE